LEVRLPNYLTAQQTDDWLFTRLVTSPATAKSKSKSTLNGQVQVRVQVLFKKGKSKSKSSRKKRTCKQFYLISILFLLLLLS